MRRGAGMAHHGVAGRRLRGRFGDVAGGAERGERDRRRRLPDEPVGVREREPGLADALTGVVVERAEDSALGERPGAEVGEEGRLEQREPDPRIAGEQQGIGVDRAVLRIDAGDRAGLDRVAELGPQVGHRLARDQRVEERLQDRVDRTGGLRGRPVRHSRRVGDRGEDRRGEAERPGADEKLAPRELLAELGANGGAGPPSPCGVHRRTVARARPLALRSRRESRVEDGGALARHRAARRRSGGGPVHPAGSRPVRRSDPIQLPAPDVGTGTAFPDPAAEPFCFEHLYSAKVLLSNCDFS